MAKPLGEDGVGVTALSLRFAHTAARSITSVVVSEVAVCYRAGQAVYPATLTNISPVNS